MNFIDEAQEVELIERLINFSLCACAKIDKKYALYLGALWNTGNIDRFMSELRKYVWESEDVR